MTYEKFVLPIKEKLAHPEPRRWADLGCGNGFFTNLLAENLPEKSEIFALDQTAQKLNPMMGKSVSIHFQKSDFEKDELILNDLNGILMANSLHFIQNKEKLVRKLGNYFADSPKFLIVEYDSNTPNPWVPFPINYEKLRDLFIGLGYQSIEKLNSKKSNYGGQMYLAMAQF